MMHCRRATQLLSAALDRKLGPGEHLALRLHLLMCRHCRNFSRQMHTLRQAAQTWRRQLDDTPGER